ncbi:hypothetical protein AA313_de0207464 [Arthrobotrys entomopaga]|nr:hypothetical protein AA313_de0207464 [Arthrobotrys entomopaga]
MPTTYKEIRDTQTRPPTSIVRRQRNYKETVNMVRAIKGVLVECDPSIKAIILDIDSKTHDFIVENLDESHLIIKDSRVAELKRILEERLNEHTKVDSLEEEEEEEDD